MALAADSIPFHETRDDVVGMAVAEVGSDQGRDLLRRRRRLADVGKTGTGKEPGGPQGGGILEEPATVQVGRWHGGASTAGGRVRLSAHCATSAGRGPGKLKQPTLNNLLDTRPYRPQDHSHCRFGNSPRSAVLSPGRMNSPAARTRSPRSPAGVHETVPSSSFPPGARSAGRSARTQCRAAGPADHRASVRPHRQCCRRSHGGGPLL